MGLNCGKVSLENDYYIYSENSNENMCECVSFMEISVLTLN